MSRLGYICLGLIVLTMVTLFNLEHVNDQDGRRNWGSSGGGSGSFSSGGGGGGHK
jgi:uncharacterized membrane protein YgcG